MRKGYDDNVNLDDNYDKDMHIKIRDEHKSIRRQERGDGYLFHE